MDSRILTGGLSFLFISLISAVAVAAEGSGRELWCVAKNNAEDAALQAALDWTCSDGGADCGPIQNGGPCYDASDLQRTASYAFNVYYIKHGPSDDNCNFANTAALTSLNPSHDSCKFSSSLSSSNGNFSLPVMAGSDSSDLSSSNSILHHWDHGLLIILLFFGSIKLVF